MKSEHLFEAIGGARDAYLLESEKKRRGRKGLFTAVVAAVLLCAMLFGAGTVALQAVRRSDLADPFSDFHFSLGAETPAKERVGIGMTLSSSAGTLYYKSEDAHSVTLILEKTTDKALHLSMRFSRSYVKNESEHHTEYGHTKVLYTTSHLILALNERATSKGVRILVDGKEQKKLPSKRGSYEIVLDYGMLSKDDYLLECFRLTSFDAMYYGRDYNTLSPNSYCELPYFHGKDDLGRPVFTFKMTLRRWGEDPRNTVEQLYIDCASFPLDAITYGGRPLEKRRIGERDYFLLDFSGEELLHSLEVFLLLYFEKDAFLVIDDRLSGSNTAYEIHRLHFPVYLNGIKEENRIDLYISARYQPEFPDEQMVYYYDLADLPWGQVYLLPTVFPEEYGKGELFKIICYPERELVQFFYKFPEKLSYGYGCTVTVGGEMTVDKLRRVNHSGVTFYYAFGESGTTWKPLTVGCYLTQRDADGQERSVAVTVYTQLEEWQAEEFIKGLQIIQ